MLLFKLFNLGFTLDCLGGGGIPPNLGVMAWRDKDRGHSLNGGKRSGSGGAGPGVGEGTRRGELHGESCLRGGRALAPTIKGRGSRMWHSCEVWELGAGP